MWIQLPLLLNSESGRDKHTNIEEQGANLAYGIWEFLKTLEFDGAIVERLNYWGENSSTTEPVKVFTRDN